MWYLPLGRLLVSEFCGCNVSVAHETIHCSEPAVSSDGNNTRGRGWELMGGGLEDFGMATRAKHSLVAAGAPSAIVAWSCHI